MLVKKLSKARRRKVRETLGDGRVIEIQVTRNGYDMAAALGDHPIVEKLLSHDSLAAYDTYRVRTREQISSVLSLLNDDRLSGADIKSIDLVRPSLEDVFVSLTGSKITAAGDAETV